MSSKLFDDFSAGERALKRLKTITWIRNEQLKLANKDPSSETLDILAERFQAITHDACLLELMALHDFSLKFYSFDGYAVAPWFVPVLSNIRASKEVIYGEGDGVAYAWANEWSV